VATAEQALAVARRELGTTEEPPGSNSTKYGRAYGVDRVYWCQIFVWWVLRQAGGEDLLPKSAYTPYVLDWFRARGRAGSEPRVGALVFFNWRDGSRPWPLPQHVGLVEAVHADGSITTIEGNTQPGNAGDQSNGGGVFRRRRARTPYVVGYGYPAYASSPAAPSSPGKDWFSMATEADLRRIVNEVVWEKKIDDLYTDNPTDGMPARAALAWAAAHAANARDRATEARGEAAAARAEVAGLRAALAAVSAGTSDPAAVRAAAEAGVAAALERFALQLVPRP
jgi:surface antigen